MRSSEISKYISYMFKTICQRYFGLVSETYKILFGVFQIMPVVFPTILNILSIYVSDMLLIISHILSIDCPDKFHICS